MRAIDYTKPELAFKRLEYHEQIRVALINGLRNESKEIPKYIKLIQKYTNFDSATTKDHLNEVYELAGLINTRQSEQNTRLEKLLKKFSYNSKTWKRFNYDDLNKSEIIIDVKPDLDSIIQTASNLSPHKIMNIKGNFLGNDDYLKHIKPIHKLMLNSNEAIKYFLENNKLKPAIKSFLEKDYNYGKNRSIKRNKNLWNLLNGMKFTFDVALKNAIQFHKENYAQRNISAITYRRPDSNEEVRLHLNDFIEAGELFSYLKKYSTIGKIIPKTDIEYKGGFGADVPSRTKIGKNHSVEFHYPVDYIPKNKPYSSIGWMWFDPYCNCEHGLNMRNFHDKKKPVSIRKMTVKVHDPHSGAYMLKSASENHGENNIATLPNNMVRILNEEAIDLLDKLRYQAIITDKKLRNLREIEFEVLLQRLAQKNDIFTNSGWQNFYLKPLYLNSKTNS